MQFGPTSSQPQAGERSENIVPMINVVFLLLIFFLMTAEIAPPPPFATDPPMAAPGEPAAGGDIVHFSAEGELAYGGARGEAVFAALAARAEDAGPLVLRADGHVPAARIAALLARLAVAGQGEVRLVTVAR